MCGTACCDSMIQMNIGLWKGMKADSALAIRQALPKNLEKYKELQQNKLFLIRMADRQAIVSTSLENL